MLLTLIGTVALVFALPSAAAAQTPEATSLSGKPLVSAPPTGDDENAARGGSRQGAGGLRSRSVERRCGDLARTPARVSRALPATRSHVTRAASRSIPNEPRLYRHRGHRYITIRKFDLAIADLRKASQLIAGKPDEIEPDGAPNKAGIPRSTLQSNIWYHLGLAQYLAGDFERGARELPRGHEGVARERRHAGRHERLALHDAAPAEARRRGAPGARADHANRWTSSRTARTTRGC